MPIHPDTSRSVLLPSSWLLHTAVPLSALAPTTSRDLLLRWRSVRVLPWLNHDPVNQMNDTQLNLLQALVASLDSDAVAQADLEAYGNAYQHLTDYLSDLLIDQGIN